MIYADQERHKITASAAGETHPILGIRKIGRMEGGRVKIFRPPIPKTIRIHNIRWIRQYSGHSLGFHYDFGALSVIGV